MVRFNLRELLFVPNLLTLFRLFFLPLPVICIAYGKDNFALALLGVAIATDVLDGYFARKLNQISELGKILDPLADKIGVAALVVALAVYRDFPWWAAAIIIVRDLLLLIGSLATLSKTTEIPTSNLFGKFTALTWVVLVISYLTPFVILQKVLLWLAVAMVPISFLLYLKKRR
ncbi:MAG: CDP-alcohol phosphatidyltransferase family protein [bacterium]|nr:CDP-alcohol phosphatidyltransferase family protein [bacterium]